MATTRSRTRARAQRQRAAHRPAPPSRSRPPTGRRFPWPAAAVVGIPLVLWLTPLLDAFSSVVFWMCVGAVIVLVIDEVNRAASEGSGAHAALLAGTTLVAVAAVNLFDPSLFDGYNALKLFVVVVGCLWLGAGALLAPRAQRWWRSPMTWPVLALLVWTTVSSLTSGAIELSILGADLSADGLLLLASLVVLFFSLLAWAETEDAHAIVRVVVTGVGGLAVYVGLLQLHDRVWGGAWDWSVTERTVDTITSTFGNPNHFGGFLAALLPLGVAVAITEARAIVRWTAAAITALAGVLVVATAARGAWFAALAGALVLVAVLPAVRRRIRATPVVLAGVVAVLVAGVVLGSSVVSLGDQVAGLVDFDDVSTTSERLAYWEASIDLAMDRPLVGVGPDAYRFAFTASQSDDYVATFGAEQIVNGPHNVFLNQLATTGVPGLVALVALVAAATLAAIGALRRLRRSDDVDAERDLSLTGALLAALVALIVQASFNVQQVATSFVFWLVLGLLAVVARDAGVPSTLSPRRLLGVDVDADARPHRASSARQYELLGAGVGAVRGVATRWLAAGPRRAELQYAEVVDLQREASFHQEIGSPQVQDLVRASSARLDDAITNNPWRARYLELKASGLIETARAQGNQPEGQPDSLQALALARQVIDDAIDIEPDNARLREGAGDIERLRFDATPDADADRVIAEYERSLDLNPYVTRVRMKLADIYADVDRFDDARDVLQPALDLFPDSLEPIRARARVEEQAGDQESADEWWDRILAVLSQDQEANESRTPLEAP